MAGRALRWFASLAFLLISAAAQADDLLMVRSSLAFPEAMNSLQQAVVRNGYVVKHVQRVDIGLTSSGYKTEEYRVVFFGKADEIRSIADRYPEMTPYLPLKIVVFAEHNTTLMVTHSPDLLKHLFNKPELAPVIDRWQRDVRKILDDAAESTDPRR